LLAVGVATLLDKATIDDFELFLGFDCCLAKFRVTKYSFLFLLLPPAKRANGLELSCV